MRHFLPTALRIALDIQNTAWLIHAIHQTQRRYFFLAQPLDTTTPAPYTSDLSP